MASRDRHLIFRTRLQQAMADRAISKSAMARATGVDRSTIGQLLKGDAPRLPNAQLAADMAMALGVSLDWLLGLTNRPELAGDILASAMGLSPAERDAADAQIIEWHQTAIGSKIRHVPATLPEMLKTPELLDWEYAALPPEAIAQIKGTARSHHDWVRTGEADYEIAMPVQELRALAEGSGYYAGLAAGLRRDQLAFLADQCDVLFPRLRLHLFDKRCAFSAPTTVFGNSLAIIYVGKFYLSLRERQRVTALTEHFDWLIRGCAVDDRHAAAYARQLTVG
ncbi:helix-turn-helix domain-containing protein [Paracoccus sp. 1_MG-2023]|uniref:helix-turn-helix domain-containing protein n=1 Tax=unclassified Paracoccus (in: a-proteobacteria) TaxID=2688777 RepID=UPI001C085307|nr:MULTISPECIES: helix-turn-helix transcriptional regulator [unclassified Paracoccus (in: a-proteobacteria)]MBU2957821.1 helix-turn-helix domain-containing protein [Paracoccus sp. C2R09]MDO6667331.1 helix-turn-helix domain-containing protein [Paracoccus sp. 1_MG-2023]